MFAFLLLSACSEPTCDTGYTFNLEGLCVVDTAAPAADADTDVDSDADADTDTGKDTDTGDNPAMYEENRVGLTAIFAELWVMTKEAWPW